MTYELNAYWGFLKSLFGKKIPTFDKQIFMHQTLPLLHKDPKLFGDQFPIELHP